MPKAKKTKNSRREKNSHPAIWESVLSGIVGLAILIWCFSLLIGYSKDVVADGLVFFGSVFFLIVLGIWFLFAAFVGAKKSINLIKKILNGVSGNW